MARDIQLDHTPSNTPTPELFRRRFSRKAFLRGSLGLLGAAALASIPRVASASEIGARTATEAFRLTPWKDIAPLDIPVVFGEYPGKDPTREEAARQKIRQVLAVAPTLEPNMETMSTDLAKWFSGTEAGRAFREPAPGGWVIFKYPVAQATEVLPERDRSKAVSAYTEVASSSNPQLAKQFLIQFSLNEALNPGNLQTYRDLYASWRFSQLAQEQAQSKMDNTDVEGLKPQVLGRDNIASLWTAAMADANQLASKIKQNPDYPIFEIASMDLPPTV